MTKEAIGAPLEVAGHKLGLSRAIRAGDFVFVSGHVALRDDTYIPGTIEEETRTSLEAIKKVLATAGCNMADVVRATVWLVDPKDFTGFNKVFKEYFPVDPPARSTVQSGLMINAKIEIEVTAYKPAR